MTLSAGWGAKEAIIDGPVFPVWFRAFGVCTSPKACLELEGSVIGAVSDGAEVDALFELLLGVTVALEAEGVIAFPLEGFVELK